MSKIITLVFFHVYIPRSFADSLLKWAHEELGDGEREREKKLYINVCVCVCVHARELSWF